MNTSRTADIPKNVSRDNNTVGQKEDYDIKRAQKSAGKGAK